jgi:hypothetical protein
VLQIAQKETTFGSTKSSTNDNRIMMEGVKDITST